MMELRHIRYFVVVAEECHFGRAAERLHIAQPPLSQQIKQLETELGVVLLHRTTRKVELTTAGARFLLRARSILAAIDAAGEEAGRIAEGLVGQVAIGFTGSATYELLPMLTRTLRQELPGVELDLKGEMLTPSQVVALHDRTLDIGFLRPPVRDPALEVVVFRREPLIVALPEEHRLACNDSVRLAELRDEPFISYPSYHRSVLHDAVYDACQRAGFRPASRHEVAETSTLITFVAAGLGVALVPASVRHLAVTGTAYRPLVVLR
ncbi:LysR substrate-binding domain-containing protein [Streptomyces sp. NPDC052701]|uniref:LysR substrate-binding domain-containing protein n=1 Tax=Streptomyces sp. NPDC052701 TaxID=3155533 RepID=UPI00342DA304